MASPHLLVGRTPDGKCVSWTPTTLDRLGKSEEYLECVLSESPSLLGLESRTTGIHGPFRIFRQLALPTPSSRVVYPDIVFLAASGHVVVVEVKRYVNRELRERSVIAQIVDYASSFSALGDEGVGRLFRQASNTDSPWDDLVQSWFPNDDNPLELAEVLLSRMQRGEINLVIACDKVPPGTASLVASIASQQALGFDLTLVETTPFVQQDAQDGEIVFASSTWLETHIVARTAVTVTYRQGDTQPSTTVLTTPLDDIKTAIEEETGGQVWTTDDVCKDVSGISDPTANALLDFAKTESTGGKFVPTVRRLNPWVIFYLEGRGDDGVWHKRVVFGYNKQWNLTVYLNSVEALLTTAEYQEFHSRLQLLFDKEIGPATKIASVSLERVAEKLHAFLDAMRWIKAHLKN